MALLNRLLLLVSRKLVHLLTPQYVCVLRKMAQNGKNALSWPEAAQQTQTKIWIYLDLRGSNSEATHSTHNLPLSMVSTPQNAQTDTYTCTIVDATLCRHPQCIYNVLGNKCQKPGSMVHLARACIGALLCMPSTLLETSLELNVDGKPVSMVSLERPLSTIPRREILGIILPYVPEKVCQHLSTLVVLGWMGPSA